MPNTAANVLVGFPLASGGVLAGPAGTTLPIDANTAPGVAFVPTGYITEDGVTQAIDSDTEEIVAWGGDIVRVINTTHALSYTFSFLETNEAVLIEVYGEENVTTTTGDFAVLINSKPLPHRAYVLEVKDGDRRVRIAIPDGQVTERGEVVYVHTDAVKYEITITCYPDAAGNKAYLYVAAATPPVVADDELAPAPEDARAVEAGAVETRAVGANRAAQPA